MPVHTLATTNCVNPLVAEEDRTDSMCEPAGQPTLAAVQVENVDVNCRHESLSSEPSVT